MKLALLLTALLLLVPDSEQRIDLAHARWLLDGRPANGAVVESPSADGADAGRAAVGDVVLLPCPSRDARWSCEFETEVACTARLALDWRPGPDGLLFELMLDGQRLTPARDGWRPSPRDLQSDLGSVWLGPGRHLFEVLPRETSLRGVLRLAALELRRL